MSDRADELYAALLAAQGDRAVLEALARVIRWNECGRESSDDNLPLPKELATWLPESPKADLAEADERLAALFGSYAEWGVFFYLYYRVAAVVDTERDPSIPVVDMDPDTKRVALLHTIEEVHAAWVAAYENDSDLLHPLAPLVAAWQRQKPPAFAHVSTTATGRGTSMTRRTKMESIIRPVPWTEAAMTGALVDGIPTATRVPDPRGIFPQRRPVRRLFRIDEQLMLKLPGIPEVPFDLRLIALQDISADPDSSPVLPNDVLVLLNLAHAADRPFVLTEHEGAALLVRHSDGTHRPVQPQYDYKRFWNASYVLRTLVVFDPAGSGRWIDMAIVEIRDVQPVDRVVIGPPHWARPITDTSKWTLTAEGSLAASEARIRRQDRIGRPHRDRNRILPGRRV